MILYAKWVWKKENYKEAFIRVLEQTEYSPRNTMS